MIAQEAAQYGEDSAADQGTPRHLARRNRKELEPTRYPESDPTVDRRPSLQAQLRVGRYYGVTEQFEAFWSPSVDVS
ncbi:hypothetical protein [Amycolatopsis sp. NPDC051372]|uniref:hypothetical protein n=1 Tax=unclassified Amycolatopsis TaxID=2618356 RepID=UPI003437C084